MLLTPSIVGTKPCANAEQEGFHAIAIASNWDIKTKGKNMQSILHY